MVGIFVGVYIYSSAALSEVEEESNQGEDNYSYSVTSLSPGAAANFSVDGLTNIGSQLEFYKDPNSFYEALIPEAVWSLDASMGDRPDRLFVGLGSETHIVFGGGFESMEFLSNRTVDFIGDKGPYSLLLPPQFQVASCGGSSAEHGDLDYCGDKDDKHSHGVSSANTLPPDPGTSTTADTDNGVISSYSASSSDQITQSNFAPLPHPIASMPLRQSGLTLQDQCDAAPGSCLIVQIDQSAMQFSSTTTEPALVSVDVPIDVPPFASPTPPIDDLTSPVDPSPPEVAPPPISVDAPGPGSDLPPVFTPPPQKPIPEISTWAMTVIGFGIIVFFFGMKRKNHANPISIVDISEGY